VGVAVPVAEAASYAIGGSEGGKVSTIQRLEAVKRGQNPRSGLCYFMGVCTLKKLSVCH